MLNRSLAGGALALLLSTPALAQTTLDTMVVTGSRTDSQAHRLADAIQVISREAIEASQASSLAELLGSVGGIEVQDYYGDGSRSSFGLRGFGENAASNALILVDGQPLNNPDIGNPDLGRIRLQDIERIEILDGGSALWGNQAVGGVIHIVTRQRRETGIQLGYGSYNSTDLRAQAGAAGEHWQADLAASRRDSDNYRDNNALERKTASLKLGAHGRLARGWVRLEHTDEFLQLPGALFAAEVEADRRQSAADFAGDFSALRSLNANAGFNADLGHNWEFSAQAGRLDTDGRFRISFRGFASEPATQDRLQLSFNPQWTHRFRSNEQTGHVALGADLQRADYLLVSQFGEQRNEQKVDDIYLTALVPFNTRLNASTTLRHSRIEDHIADAGDFAALPDGRRLKHEETVGSLGLSLQLNQQLVIFAGGDQVLRYPKVDEYFGSGYTPDTIGLEPQTGDNLELGLRYTGNRVQGSLTGYRLELDNEIVYDPGSFSNTNLPRTRRNGVTAHSRIQLGGKLALDLDYSRIDAKINGAERIPLVAEQHGQLSVDFQALPQLSLRAQVQASGDRLAGGDTDASASRLPGYAQVNLAASLKLDKLSLGLRLNNVLDKQYAAIGFEDGFSGDVAVFPLPQFNARLNLDYRFE